MPRRPTTEERLAEAKKTYLGKLVRGRAENGWREKIGIVRSVAGGVFEDAIFLKLRKLDGSFTQIRLGTRTVDIYKED